jgi:hypothetical protein
MCSDDGRASALRSVVRRRPVRRAIVHVTGVTGFMSMKRRLYELSIAGTIAFTVAVTAHAAAQGQAPNSAGTPSSSGSTSSPAAGGVTVDGCLLKEVDVPGRRPPEDLLQQAERDNNFVLTTTSVTQGSAPADAPGPLMYKVQGLKKGELKTLAGKRVTIEGRFDKLGRAKNQVSFATDLVELKGAVIRVAGGDCAPK